MALYRNLASLLPALAILLSPGVLGGRPDPNSTFRVMLQGASEDAYADILEQVEASGAEVIHRLPIINALGARVSASQLERITDSPGIVRLIDDLDAIAPEPEEPADKTECGAAGALELTYRDSGLHWRLYNKEDVAQPFTGMTVKWPENLGVLKKVLWAGDPIEVQENDAEAGNGKKSFAPLSPQAIDANDDIEISLLFSQPVDADNYPQRAFTLEAQLGEDCAVELIPGYPDNSADTYYPTVTGADLLHRHGITGDGITVAVLDSGLWEHEEIALDTQGNTRVIARYDAVADQPDASFDESGHGTHMTSIIAQSGRIGTPGGSGFRGIAPDVDLVSIKAFEADGEGDFLNIVRGLQWVYDNRER
ncbi:MAG: S8 family serine peptidase [Chromatocurvus sp.]